MTEPQNLDEKLAAAALTGKPKPKEASNGAKKPQPGVQQRAGFGHGTARAPRADNLAPPPKPPPAPDVAVTYSVDGKSWWDHFRVYLTIVNRSSQTVSGWTIRLTLPGDRVDWVGYRQGWRGNSFSSWNFSGKPLPLTANSGGEALGPGASPTLTIDARGNTRSPSGCVFNGAACHS